MADISRLKPNKDMIDKENQFFLSLDSDMKYQSNYLGDMITFDWLDEIEEACPFIDIIIRIPKNALIREEEITLIEKSKKVDLASIKELAKHTENINKYDKKTASIEPSKILDIRNEETFNIYENRFLYTLVDNLDKFVAEKEKMLNNFEIGDSKLLEYAASTRTKYENINVLVKLTSKSIPSNALDKKIKDEISNIKKRLKKVKEYIESWQKSEMIKSLKRAHVKFIEPPIKKTNITLKNPNFKIAVKLWEYILKYDYEENKSEKDNYLKKDDNILLTFLDQAFLIDYLVSDSAVPSKRDQKVKMAEASMIILKEQIMTVIRLLKGLGYDVTEEGLFKIIGEAMKKDTGERLVGAEDVKKKFKNAMEEYLERTQNYL